MAKLTKAMEPFRSEHLRTTRILFEPAAHVPALPPPLLMVTDTNTVLRSIARRAQMTAPNARTILQELADSGFVTFIAPPQLLREVDDHLHDLGDVAAPLLEVAKIEVLRSVHIIKVRPGFKCRSAAYSRVKTADRKDTAFARLFEFARADCIVSKDRHLTESGYPVVGEDVDEDVMLTKRKYLRALAGARGRALVLQGSAQLSVAGFSGMQRTLGWMGLSLLVGGVGLALLDDRVRAWTTSKAKQVLGAIAGPMAAFFQEMKEQAALARALRLALEDPIFKQRRVLTSADAIFRLCLMRGATPLDRIQPSLREFGLLLPAERLSVSETLIAANLDGRLDLVAGNVVLHDDVRHFTESVR